MKMPRIQLCDIAAVFFAILSTLLGVELTNNLGYTLCTSPICEETGQDIINSMDKNVLPCADFYQHACGGWIAKHPIPSFHQFNSQFVLIAHKVNQELKALLENNVTNDTGAIRKAKDFYNICINRAAIDKNRWTNLEAMVTVNGEWPLIDPVNSSGNAEQRQTWQKMHENFMNATEFAGLFQLTVDVQLMEPKNYVITLQSVVTPGQEWREVFLIISKLARLRADRNLNSIEDVKKMLKFEAELKKAYTYNITADDSNTEYRVTTIEEMQNIWNVAVNNSSEYKIDWLDTIRRRFDGIGVVINANETIALKPGIFLQQLGAVLLTTPIPTIVNYIHWYAVSRGIKSLDLTNSNLVNGQSKKWCECCRNHGMNHALSVMYVKEHFNKPHISQLRESILEIYHHMRETAKETIDNSIWMDKETREMFRDKIDDITFNLGYPDWYDEPDKLDEYYEELTISSDHFENILAVDRFNNRKALLNLRKPVIKTEIDWATAPTDPVSRNHRMWNTIYIPAAILQMPVFHYEKPSALKFGAMGAIIGHEIFHGFDFTGLTRDKHHNYRFWLPTASVQEYVKRATCIVNQFNQYPVSTNQKTKGFNVLRYKTRYVDGTKTLNENIGDNAGFSMGFKAFQRYKRFHPNETVKIPALVDYSNEKLFFYGLANVFCDVQTRSSMNKESIYPPNAVRINGALSNIQAFSDSFACTPEDKMNPSDKCMMWD